MNKLRELYCAWRGEDPAAMEKLPGAGSNRVYYRLTDHEGRSVVGVVGTSCDENHAFVYLARHFAQQQLPVPQVLAVSDDELRYLQTDLGSTSLFDALRRGREAGGDYNEEERALLRQTIRELPRIQVLGARGLDWSNCYPQPAFDRDGVMFDLNYFKYCFLKATGVDFHEMKLEHDFRQLAKDLTESDDTQCFLYRDFQARNIMLIKEQGARGKGQEGSHHSSPAILHPSSLIPHPFFIDFQGGRRGPVYYDLASFLWQASAKYPAALREELIREYYEALRQYTAVPSEQQFRQRLQLFVLFRTLQVLGAYGFRGYFERKKHFIESIPPAIDNLKEAHPQPLPRGGEEPTPAPFQGGRALGQVGAAKQSTAYAEYSEYAGYNVLSAYPYLSDVLYRLIASQKTAQQQPSTKLSVKTPLHLGGAGGGLIVRIFSFSYKKGIPGDESGNGGGYVFDCRSTHNPGRYEPYKQLTGLDEPVIRFLEDDGEILTFLDSVYKLADAHVARYIERGFTSLMFSFGCTGGQHRSVYSAQHLAEHLHAKFGIEVHLCHREQGITQVLEARKT